MVFKLGEHEIVLTKDTFGKRVSYAYFERIFNTTWKEIEQWVQNCSFDQMVEKCRDIQGRLNDIIYLDVAVYWKAVGETTSDIEQKYCDYIHDDSYMCEVIQTSCEGFKELKEYADSFNDRDSVVYTARRILYKNGYWRTRVHLKQADHAIFLLISSMEKP